MVDELQPAGVLAVVVVERPRPDRSVPGQEGAARPQALQGVLAAAGDEAVDAPAVGLDAGHDHGPVAGLVAQLDRLVGGLAAVPDGLLVRRGRVPHGERQVLDPVAVPPDLLLGRVVLGQTRRQKQPDVALAEQAVSLLPGARREIGVLAEVEPEAVAVEVRRLPGVAHVKADVVDVDQPEGVGAGLGPGHRRRSAGGRHGVRSP